MIHERSRSGIVWMLLVAILAALVVPAVAGDKQRTRAIEFSAPQSSITGTNPASRKDGLRQLEEELFQPFQQLAPKSSLDGVMPSSEQPPPPVNRPAIPNKRAKEMRERMKYWMFMAPEDQVKGLTPEEIFNLPELDNKGQEKKKLSPIEKYYQRLDEKKDGRKSGMAEKDNDPTNSKNKQDSEDDPSNSDDLDKDQKSAKDGDHVLKSVFQPDKGLLTPLTTPNAFPDIFGLAKHELSPEEVQKQKAHERELQQTMQQLYDNPFAKLGAPGDTPTHSLAPGNSLDIFSSTPTMSQTPSAAAMPSFNPGVPDITSKALTPALPPPQLKVDAPKIAPPVPTFEPPKRVF